MSKVINCDPQTKEDWRELLEYLYQAWRNADLPVTVYPPMYCKNALRLDGIIGCRSIGRYS